MEAQRIPLAISLDDEPVATPLIERRLVDQALTRWHTIRNGVLPSRSDFESRGLPFSPAHLFYIQVNAAEAEDRIIDAGSVLAEALGIDPAARPVGDVLPSARDRGMAFHRAAAAHGKPLADSGHTIGVNGALVMYRCLLLPLRPDRPGSQIVAGAFSFKPVK